MANAKQCDICKKFYAASKVDRRLGTLGIRDTSAIVLCDINKDAEELETCPECMEKIKAFINDMEGE